MKKINEHLQKLAEAKVKNRNIEPKGKATAELEASKNPMRFLRTHKNMKIKGLKGIAF